MTVEPLAEPSRDHKRVHADAKAALRAISIAPTRAAALDAARVFSEQFAQWPKATAKVTNDLEPALDLGAVLAFRHVRTVARDNTVKYRWRTLQLLPGPERTSYAGVQVEVPPGAA